MNIMTQNSNIMKSFTLFVFLCISTQLLAQQPQLWVQGDAADTTFMEGFESNTLGTFTTGGGVDWFVTNLESFEGILSVRAGDIPNFPADTSWLELTVNIPGHMATLSFALKASTDNFETIEFFIDGDKKIQLTGETPWQMYSYLLAPGSHVLRWHYRSPGAISAPPDGSPESLPDGTVYLDAVTLTAVTNPSVRIEDGTEGLGKILTSDSLGNAAWVDPGIALQPAQQDLPWVLCDSLPQTAPLILCNDATSNSSALHIRNAYYGIQIDTAYANGILIRDPQFNGIYVNASGSHAFRTFRSGVDGYYSELSGDDGFHAFIPENYGFHADRSGSHGFYSQDAGRDFLGNIVNANANGFQASSAANHGFYSTNADGNGFYALNSGNHGVQTSNSTTNGFQSTNAGNNGFYALRSSSHGFHSVNAGRDFFGNVVNFDASAFEASNSAGNNFHSFDAGVNGFEAINCAHNGFVSITPANYGFYSGSSGSHGFYASNSGEKGVYVTGAGEEAGRFENSNSSTSAALYARHGNEDEMDMYIGGEARIATHGSFDFHIDENNNESNEHFFIKNSSGQNVRPLF